MALHERIKYARLQAGLSGSQVRERVGIGESSLSEFEAGKREPSLSQLQKLAGLYRRSLAFFFAQDMLAAEPTVLWRERPQQNAAETQVQFLRLCEQYHNLEVWCGEHVPSRLPSATEEPAQFAYPQAQSLAKRVRQELQLGDRPALSLLNTLEEVCGVKIFHLDFEPSGAAASTVSATFGSAVLLNSRNARWRRNFDLAHELFHLLTWSIFHSGTGPAVIDAEKEEKLATCFARHLLMPIEPFRMAIDSRLRDGKIPFESLFDVAREFDVSMEAVLWHMHFEYGRVPAQADQTKQDIAKAEMHAAFLAGRDDSKPHRWPARYHALAVKALRRGEMAIGRFAEYLDITRQEAMRCVEKEIGDGEEVQVTPA